MGECGAEAGVGVGGGARARPSAAEEQGRPHWGGSGKPRRPPPPERIAGPKPLEEGWRVAGAPRTDPLKLKHFVSC